MHIVNIALYKDTIFYKKCLFILFFYDKNHFKNMVIIYIYCYIILNQKDNI